MVDVVEMEQRLQAILAELRELHQEFEQFRTSTMVSRNIIEAMLRRRGIHEVKYTPREHIVLPQDCSKVTENMFYLKTFLKLRDTREEFAEIKAKGLVGIPCVNVNDGEALYFEKPSIDSLI